MKKLISLKLRSSYKLYFYGTLIFFNVTCFLSHSGLNKNSLALFTKENLFISPKTSRNIIILEESANYYHSDFDEGNQYSPFT